MADENKQFEASGRKLSEARNQGNVFKSRDLTTAIVLIVMFMFLFHMGAYIWHEVATLFILIFEQIPNKTIEAIGWQYLTLLTVKALVFLIGPFILVGALVSWGADFFQVGSLFATAAISPKFDKLNPAAGLKNLFNMRSLIELAKNIIKISILGWMAWVVFQKYFGVFLAVGATENIFTIMTVLSEMMLQFIFSAGSAFLFIGLADFLYQRWKYLQDQKMSFKEVKDEFKNTEGDPMVKQALRQRRMELLQKGMLEAVPTADVVTTNPIHIAVALKYNADVMEAPRVVAKGTELFAERIKEIAKRHGVPVVENPVVARTLFRLVDIDREIPPELYQAVAEILMFAWRLTGKSPPVSS